MSDTNIFSAIYKGKKTIGDFSKMTWFEIYGVKTSEKANMHNEHWLTSTVYRNYGMRPDTVRYAVLYH